MFLDSSFSCENCSDVQWKQILKTPNIGDFHRERCQCVMYYSVIYTTLQQVLHGGTIHVSYSVSLLFSLYFSAKRVENLVETIPLRHHSICLDGEFGLVFLNHSWIRASVKYCDT